MRAASLLNPLITDRNKGQSETTSTLSKTILTAGMAKEIAKSSPVVNFAHRKKEISEAAYDDGPQVMMRFADAFTLGRM
ncbi:MAG: hypothetical protein WBA51_04970 [Erythrobacter sp.]